MKKDNTIVAISTPVGSGGIGIVRMSGIDALKIAKKIFNSKQQLTPRTLVLGDIKTSEFIEKGMCVYFKAPHSYTGEDMIEFQCHGGSYLVQGVLNECLNKGAIMANNGEFTQRAFINGKVNLAQSEGIIDMINAESEAEIRAGYNLLKGELGIKVNEYQKILIDLISEIEVALDYPENDIDFITKDKIKEKILNLIDQIQLLLKNSTDTKLIKDGVNVLIIGKPNVGKSSLLNALIGEEKAIVTNIPGTTRDLVEARYVYKGIKFNFIDTAGIHKTTNTIENIGIERTKDQIKKADLILFVLDMENDVDEKDIIINKLISNKKKLILLNKSDKNANLQEFLKKCEQFMQKFDNYIKISAKNRDGIDELKQKIYDITVNKNLLNNMSVVINTRHIESLKKSLNYLNRVIDNIDNMPLDVINIDIVSCWQSLGEITGTTANEEIINNIFAKFCLGK